MTVAQLIAALQGMPQNAHVLHYAVSKPGHSDFREVHDVTTDRCKWNEDDLEYLEGGPINGEPCVVIK